LTWEQEMNLILGGKTIEEIKREGIKNPIVLMAVDGTFEDDQERREAWESHGYKLRTSPGTKPQAHHDYQE
jgi:hypothetical protein